MLLLSNTTRARTHSGPPSTGITVTMDGGVADTARESRRDPTITSDLVSTYHHMDTAQREFVLEIRAMLSIATHSFLAGSYRSTELSPGSETC